jgi:hypothetical protein
LSEDIQAELEKNIYNGISSDRERTSISAVPDVAAYFRASIALAPPPMNPLLSLNFLPIEVGGIKR